MLALISGVPGRVWALLGLIVFVPPTIGLIGFAVARRWKLGIATRLATRAVAVTGLGFGVLAAVATLSVLSTGLREIRRRHLPAVVNLASAVSALDRMDTPGIAQQLAVFRAREPEAGPVVAWREYCGSACLVVATNPDLRERVLAWGAELVRATPRGDNLLTTTIPGDLHLVLTSATRDARGLPDGRVAVTVQARWIADQALRTAALLVVIAYVLILSVWWLIRGMIADSVASRVERLVAQLDAAETGDVPADIRRTPARGTRGDELSRLAAGVRAHIASSVDRLREADRRTADARALAVRMESTATLAAGVAHDFNNLMMGVMANTQVLRKDVRDAPAAQETMETILECADRGGKLAQQLLAFARGGRYNPTVINLNESVRSIARLDTGGYGENVQLSTTLAPNLLNVEADPTQIEQVLDNLIRNGAEALGEAGGHVHVRTRNVTLGAGRPAGLENLPAGPYVEVVVQDTGPGMSEETLARVFEPFFTTKRRGRGMGLAAVYGIVLHHGGHIEMQSAPDRGTRVTMHLPATEAAVVPAARRPVATSKGSGTILLVDDEVAILSPGKRLLERAGYRVLVAENGAEAVEIARGTGDAIDVILLDMRMPVMDGEEAFGPLSQACPEAKVIICSGYELDAAAQRLLDAGASAFVSKPFLIEDLLTEIEMALGHDPSAPVL